MHTPKIILRGLFLAVAAFICAARVGYASGAAIVEIPTAETNDASGLGQDLTMGGEHKSTKNVIEEQKPVCWNWAADIGYESEYNFRGTNLTPDADGAGFIQAEVSRWGFTLGAFGIHQFGTARSNSFSMGEGGGGGTNSFGSALVPNPFFPAGFGSPFVFLSGTVSPQTIQSRFNEIDVFLQYQRSFGWVDVTVGNIGFFIDRRAVTFVDLANIVITDPILGVIPLGNFSHLGPFRTVENEQFDRFYLTLSTSKIPHIQPVITYYQTVLNTGTQPKTLGVPLPQILEQRGVPPAIASTFPTLPFYHGGERDEELAGYLDARLRGNFPITEWLSVNPQAVISASFHDRGEPVADPVKKKEAIRGRSLSGWNVAQLGLDIPIHVLHLIGFSSGPCAPPDLNVSITPFGWYSYHISDPTPSTDRNEFWGGVKLTATF